MQRLVEAWHQGFLLSTDQDGHGWTLRLPVKTYAEPFANSVGPDVGP